MRIPDTGLEETMQIANSFGGTVIVTRDRAFTFVSSPLSCPFLSFAATATSGKEEDTAHMMPCRTSETQTTLAGASDGGDGSCS